MRIDGTRTHDDRCVLDLGRNRQPVGALEDGVGQLADFFVTTIRADRIDPGDEPAEIDRIDTHVVVRSTRCELNQATVVRKRGHRLGRYVTFRICGAKTLDHNRIGDSPPWTRFVRFLVGRTPGRLAGQCYVRLLKHEETGARSQIENLGCLAIALMAFTAILVEHRLYVPIETHRMIVPGRWRDLARSPDQ